MLALPLTFILKGRFTAAAILGETGMNCRDLFRSRYVLVWVEGDERHGRDWTDEAKKSMGGEGWQGCPFPLCLKLRRDRA